MVHQNTTATASVMPISVEHQAEEVLSIDSETTSTVADGQRLQQAIERAGRALLAVIGSTGISAECKTALEQMAASGDIPDLRLVELISSSGVLVECAKQHREATGDRLTELREAMAACATLTITTSPVVELLSLWSVVHESVRDASSQEDAAQPGNVTTGVLEDATDNEWAIGKILATAMASSRSLASSVSQELYNAVQLLAESGTPVADHLIGEVERQLALVHEALPTHKWEELASLCSQALATEWRAVGETAVAISNLEKGKSVSGVYDSAVAAAIAAEGFSGLDGVLGESREVVDGALAAIRDGNVATPDTIKGYRTRPRFSSLLLRLEVLRDFFQIVDLYFTGSYGSFQDLFKQDNTPSSTFLTVLRGFCSVMALNFLALVEKTSQSQELVVRVGLAILLAAFSVVYVGYVWFAFSVRRCYHHADDSCLHEEGHLWHALAKKRKVRREISTFVITACLTVYLPLTQLSTDVLKTIVTSPTDVEADSSAANAIGLILIGFRHDATWSVVVSLAVFVFLTFTIPFPCLLYRVITKTRPASSLHNPLTTHDLEGRAVPFDDVAYARLVERDPRQQQVPYRSLYAGLKQRWCYFKVVQLILKLALALIVELPADTNSHIRSSLTCAICVIASGIVCWYSPFSDPLNNAMAISCNVAALITCVGGALGTFNTTRLLLDIVPIVVDVAHGGNMIVMLVVFMLNMRGARVLLNNLGGCITFSDSTRGLVDVSATKMLPYWDVSKEVKHRVWQAFWRSLILEMEMSQHCRESQDPIKASIAHRLEVLEETAMGFGIHCIRSHWRGQENEYVSQLRIATQAALEGVDVFWKQTSGGPGAHLKSKTCFGKLCIVPYPFQCAMVYDDATDKVTVLDDADPLQRSKLEKLLFVNFSPNIVAKRSLRQKLRVLSEQGTKINFRFGRDEPVSVEDGYITRRVDDGGIRKVKRYSTVTFRCRYTHGVIHVASKADANKSKMAEGFDVTVTYRDGCGFATAPHTGIVHTFENRVAVMGPDHIGLTPDMEESRDLEIIFNQTRSVWEHRLVELQAQHQAYRGALQHKYLEANAVLSDAFWYFVYNNPHLSRQELEYHLKHREGNPHLQSLLDTHRSALDALYLRMKFVQSHPALAFWYTFWDDVYAQNGDMKHIRAFKSDFDPSQPSSICYQPKLRSDLEGWLGDRKLLGSRRLFYPQMLDSLYAEMERRLQFKTN